MKNYHCSAIADHIHVTGHNIKWDNFYILASEKTDYHCKIKQTLLIYELKLALNVNVGSEKLLLYWQSFCFVICTDSFSLKRLLLLLPISYPESSGSLVSGLVARRDSGVMEFFFPEIRGSGCSAHA